MTFKTFKFSFNEEDGKKVLKMNKAMSESIGNMPICHRCECPIQKKPLYFMEERQIFFCRKCIFKNYKDEYFDVMDHYTNYELKRIDKIENGTD
jgi:hypothetical protein